MNKTKMVLAGIGGAIGLVVLVLAFLVWQAFSAKTAAIEGDEEEGTDGLETVLSRAQGLSRKPVYPCAASLKALEANQAALDGWCKEGLSLAARGDRVFAKTTPAQFKTDLVADAKRLGSLPGAANGKLMKPDFAFGPFKAYITEGKLPAEAELAELQRKWDDVATITELLATNGVAELLDVQFKVAAAAESADARDRRGKGDKRDRRKSPQAAAPAAQVSPAAFSYVFTFAARPSAFVRALNALEESERFITVDDFTLGRTKDAIAEALGGGERKPEQAASGRRGRRGRRGGAEADANPPDNGGKDAASAQKNGIVTDPLLDAPMTVTMTVAIHDFRSLEDRAETEKKGDSK